jgi:hypothetical protein
MPEMMLAGDLDTLSESWTKHEVTQGEPPLSSTEDLASCSKDAAFTSSFVLIHNANKPLVATELSRIVASVTDAPSEARVSAFLLSEPHSAFAQVFDSAGQVWQKLHLISSPAKAADAIDRRFLSAETPSDAAAPPSSKTDDTATAPAPSTPKVETPETDALKSAGPKYGYPSSIFDF